MWRRMLLASVASVALAGAAVADSGNQWIHVRVEENGPRGEKVRVNLPLSMVASVLPNIDADDFRNGRIHFDGHDEWDARQVRAIWEAARTAPDGEFVVVEGHDEDVRVSREKGFLLIKVDEHGRRGSKVDIKVPVTVVDALLTGEDDELNILAAIEALGKHGNMDLVSVIDDDSHVRIWVDNDASGKAKDAK